MENYSLKKDMYDFEGGLGKVYKESCKKCNKKFRVSTQKDSNPEYNTCIYIMCDCGNSVEFILPVN